MMLMNSAKRWHLIIFLKQIQLLKKLKLLCQYSLSLSSPLSPSCIFNLKHKPSLTSFPASLASDLETLSRKGHFLKGSSAALGLQRVQHSCESMQHFGNQKDENGEGNLSEVVALKKCKALLKRLREEQEEAKGWLEGFYKG